MGSGVWGLGFRVQGFEARWGSGSRGLGVWVLGLGFRVQGLGSRDQGLGSRV